MNNPQISFRVDRRDFRRIDISTTAALPALREGEVLLGVDRFALTSNNVSYATLGEPMGFWQVFPAPRPWGSLPVWGFADVVASRHPELAVGERVFGFVPMATHAVLAPTRVTARGFTDAAPHRAELFPTYNQYARVPGGAADPQQQNLHALVRPLFFTSFVLEDFLDDHAHFGARTVLLSSASSKTALGAAFLLRGRAAVRVCGLTSARHRGFVASTGCFDAVFGYDELGALDLSGPVAYVDFSGDAALRHAVHRHLGAALVHSLRIGSTHWDAGSEAEPPPGVAAQAFFGPAQIRKRRSDWGDAGLHARYDAAQARFLAAAAGWLRVDLRQGVVEVERAYREVLQGGGDPARGFVCRMAPADPAEPPPLPGEERAALSFLQAAEPPDRVRTAS